MENIREIIEKSISTVLDFIIFGFNVLLTFFMVLGSIASMVLLYKMFPDTALIFLKPMFLVLDFFTTFLQASLILLFILGLGYLWILIGDYGKRIHKRREIDRKKFLDEVVRKINKGRKSK